MKKLVVLISMLFLAVALVSGLSADEDTSLGERLPSGEAVESVEAPIVVEEAQGVDFGFPLNLSEGKTEVIKQKPQPDPYDHIDCSEYDDSVCTWERIPWTCCCRAVTGPCQTFCV